VDASHVGAARVKAPRKKINVFIGTIFAPPLIYSALKL